MQITLLELSKHTRFHNTVAFKISIASCSKQNSIRKTAVKFWVDRKSIKKWIQQSLKLAQVLLNSKTQQKGKERCQKYRKWVNWMDLNDIHTF